MPTYVVNSEKGVERAREAMRILREFIEESQPRPMSAREYAIIYDVLQEALNEAAREIDIGD